MPRQHLPSNQDSAEKLAGDKHLSTWRKEKAPAIAGPPKGMRLTGFRDPFVIRRGSPGQPWQLIIGSGIKDEGGTILLYQSDAAATGVPAPGCSLPAALPLSLCHKQALQSTCMCSQLTVLASPSCCHMRLQFSRQALEQAPC